MSERAVQNEIRNALAPHGLFFRANVGQAWTGHAQRISRGGMTRVDAGDVVLRDARPFSSGLPAGFADLFGLVPVTIAPGDVGATFARFAALEVKDTGGRPTKQQLAFIQAVQRNGGLGGICRSAAAALDLLGVR